MLVPTPTCRAGTARDDTSPGGTLELADGRRLAYDDVGDPDGRPIVYLHGCPDSRLTRHPDDSIAARAGVRLIAVDRPGYGSSDPPADWTLESVAGDVAALVDHLGIDQCAALGWSSGGPVRARLARWPFRRRSARSV